MSVRNRELADFDFVLGTLAGATKLDSRLEIKSGDRKVDQSFRMAYLLLEDLIDKGEEKNLFTTFVIAPDEIYGISNVVFDSMSLLHSIDRVRRDGYSNVYRLNVSRQSPLQIIENIPAVSTSGFQLLGQTFIQELESA